MTIQSNQRALASDILQEHNSDGTHSIITATSLASTTITNTGLITTNTLSVVASLTMLGSLTTITGTELETLSDGSNADALHTHATITDDQVRVDVAATRDYIGAANNDGVLRTDALMTYVDGGNFVTLNVNEAALTHDNLIAGTIVSHDTTATGANLTTLTDTSNADALHSHATITDDRVKVDVAATRDYIGATNADGVIRTGALLTYVDGGNFVTINTDEAALTHDNLIAGTIASHDTTATGAELNTLTGGGDVGALHTHAAAYAPISGAVDVATFVVANEVADATCFPLFATAATGSLGAKSNAGLTFDSTTATLTATNIAGANTNWDAAFTHVSSDGSDHSFIDQSVVSGATPTFTGTNFTGIPYTGLANGIDGELITWDAAGAIATVAVGAATQVLTSNGPGTAPTFQASPAGFPDPMTTRGDIIIRNAANATDRLGIGANTFVLTSDGTDIAWAAAAASGANTALSNLAAVAINTSLISDADNADALGSAANGWTSLFLSDAGGAPTTNGEITYNLGNTRFEFYQNGGVSTLGGSPGGVNTQLQYNNAGAFGGMTDVTWSAPTLTLGATAVLDAGGCVSVELPNAAGGTTVNAAGEITVDTTSRTLNLYDGTIEAVIQPIMSRVIAVEAPTAAEDSSIGYIDDAVTITKIVCVLIGSSTPSVTWTVRHGTDRSAAGAEAVTAGTTTTSTTTGSVVTVFNDATVVADSFMWLETTAQSGTVDEMSITIYYRQDA